MVLASGSGSVEAAASQDVQPVIKVEAPVSDQLPLEVAEERCNEPRVKRERILTGDEFEAALGIETTIDSVDLSISDVNKADV